MKNACGPGGSSDRNSSKRGLPYGRPFINAADLAKEVMTVAEESDSMPSRKFANIEIYRIDTGYLFRIVGRGTLRESPAVRDFVCGAMEDGAAVVMDLSECEHLDSTFLGCLVILHQRAERDGGSFVLFADAAVRRELFSLSRLDTILVFIEQRPPCIGEPVTLQITHLERKEFCQHLLATHRRLAELGGPAAETFQHVVEQLRRDLDHFRRD